MTVRPPHEKGQSKRMGTKAFVARKAGKAARPATQSEHDFCEPQPRLPHRVQILIDASLADNTHRAYDKAFRAFCKWCDKRRHLGRPARPEVVAEYLADLISAGLRGASLRVHAYAIAHHHRRHNLANPIDAYVVRAVMRGSMRLRGSYVDQKRPLVIEEMARIVEKIPATLRGKRDAAILALGFAGALRRSEIVALKIEDLAFSDQGVVVTIRKSKTDTAGSGTIIAIPNGRVLKPVAALKEWISVAQITKGPVIRPVYRSRVVSRFVTPGVVSRILKSYVAEIELEPAFYGSHSMRSGFITSAADEGVAIDRIMDHSRHADMRVLLGYIRRANLFRGHAGANFL